MKTWYLKHPISKYYDVDVKREAKKAEAKIIDFKFIGDEKNPNDCPKEIGYEEPKKRTRKPKEEKVEEIDSKD